MTNQQTSLGHSSLTYLSWLPLGILGNRVARASRDRWPLRVKALRVKGILVRVQTVRVFPLAGGDATVSIQPLLPTRWLYENLARRPVCRSDQRHEFSVLQQFSLQLGFWHIDECTQQMVLGVM